MSILLVHRMPVYVEAGSVQGRLYLTVYLNFSPVTLYCRIFPKGQAEFLYCADNAMAGSTDGASKTSLVTQVN